MFWSKDLQIQCLSWQHLRTNIAIESELNCKIFDHILIFSFQSTFCSDVMSDDGTTAVDANEYCGDDAEGYMEVCEDDDYYYILTSGAPNHPAEYDQVITNPNERCKLIN